MSEAEPVVPYPKLAFRIGFAGKRWRQAGMEGQGALREPEWDEAAIREALGSVFDKVGGALQEILDAKRGGEAGSGRSMAADYYAAEPGAYRLVTGLAEGADAAAADVFLQNQPGGEAMLDRSLVGVVPFPLDDYRKSREPWFKGHFQALVEQCEAIYELDGIYDKPDPDTTLAKLRRSRAYRGQARLLLQQCDVLVALTDPVLAGGAGGTRETIDHALALELPVVLVQPLSDGRTPWIHFIKKTDDYEALCQEAARSCNPAANEGSLKELEAYVRRLVGRSGHKRDGRRRKRAKAALLEELFHHWNKPAKATTANGQGKSKRRKSLHEWVWNGFEGGFRTLDRWNRNLERFWRAAGIARRKHGVRHLRMMARIQKRRQSRPAGKTGASADELESEVRSLRDRVRELNYHYVGRYRGSFLINYAFAFLATATEVVRSTYASGPVMESLLSLVYLLFLVCIFFNTLFANGWPSGTPSWNERAIRYRFLAERLRAALYLPRIGILRLPALSRVRETSTGMQQSDVEWLAHAWMRALPPRLAGKAGTEEKPASPAVVRFDAQTTLDRRLRLDWIRGQRKYHAGLSHYRIMATTLKWLGGTANIVGILLAGLVIAAAILQGLGIASQTEFLLNFQSSIWISLVKAVLPIVATSLAGIRFQSECSRLYERSQHFKRHLEDLENQARHLRARMPDQMRENSTDDLGSWDADTAAFAAELAHDMAEEVADWSVIYEKEVQE